MFLGHYVHSIDAQGRVAIPAKFRAELADGLVVTRGIDRCLAIYSTAEWKKVAERVSGLPTTARRARAYRRLVFADASAAVPDGQGRALIPQRLREYAGLVDDAVITGLDTFIEVWSPDMWSKERDWVEAEDADGEQWADLDI